MEPERRPRRRVARRERRGLLNVVCLRIQARPWLERRRGGGAGDGELRGSAALAAINAATAALAADLAATAVTAAVLATDLAATAAAALAAAIPALAAAAPRLAVRLQLE